MRPTLVNRRKRLLVGAFDAVLFAVAYASAYLVRLDITPYPAAATHFEQTVLTVVLIKVLIFGFLGTYRGLVLYATLPDLLTLVRHSTIASTAVIALFQVLPGHRPYSRGVLVVDWVLTIALLSASRVAWRMYREGVIGSSPALRNGRRKVLIAGAGRAGVAVAKDLIATRGQEVEVVGFVDDDPDKQGATLLGRPILGTTSDLPEIPRCRRIDQIIVAIPSASPRVLRRIAELARGVRDFRVLPSLESLLRGQAALVQAMPVPTESFLSRDTVDLAASDLRRFFEGKTILVTGAGGSIGSELSRQLAETGGEGPRRLILLDSAETPLYDVLRQTRASPRLPGGGRARLGPRCPTHHRRAPGRTPRRDPARRGPEARAPVRGASPRSDRHQRVRHLPPRGSRSRPRRLSLHPRVHRQGGRSLLRHGSLQARGRELRSVPGRGRAARASPPYASATSSGRTGASCPSSTSRSLAAVRSR